MKRFLTWLWDRGIVSTFATGLFVFLPVVLTVAIMSWMGSKLLALLEPVEWLGRLFVQNPAAAWIAWLVGAALVLAGIWALGAVVKATARQGLEEAFHAVMNRIPLVRSIYKPVSQVVNLIKGDDKADVKGMSVVYCMFGAERGGGFLGLLASPDIFHVGGQDCKLVYIPTSPVPMSGGLVFVPLATVQAIDMAVDDVMKIYFSLGVLSSQVMPDKYKVTPPEA